MLGKSGVTDGDERSLPGRFQFPTDRGGRRARPTGSPGVDEEARRIDFVVFAGDLERAGFATDTLGRPLSADAQIGFELAAAIGLSLPFASPPLQHLARINQGLKDALRLSRDVNLANEFVSQVRG